MIFYTNYKNDRGIRQVNKNQAVLLYGAGFRGARNFEALTAENIRVEAFCDRDAEYIQL